MEKFKKDGLVGMMKMAEPQQTLTPEQELYLDYASEAQRQYNNAGMSFIMTAGLGTISTALYFFLGWGPITSVPMALSTLFSLRGVVRLSHGKAAEQKAQGALAGISRDTLDEHL